MAALRAGKASLVAWAVDAEEIFMKAHEEMAIPSAAPWVDKVPPPAVCKKLAATLAARGTLEKK